MALNFSYTYKTQHEYKRDRERKVNEMRRVISSWDKQKIQAYVYNHNKEYPVSDAGMAAILERFIQTDEFKIGTMSEEQKMGFDIVLSIARNMKIYFQTTDIIYEFIKYYEDVIHHYDRQSAQTYRHKLKQAYTKSLELVEAKTGIEREMNVKY